MKRKSIAIAASALLMGLSASSGWAQIPASDALIATVAENCKGADDACSAALATVLSQVSQLTEAEQASFGAQLAFLVIQNPLLEPRISAALIEAGSRIVVAAYNATNGDLPEIVLPGSVSPA